MLCNNIVYKILADVFNLVTSFPPPHITFSIVRLAHVHFISIAALI